MKRLTNHTELRRQRGLVKAASANRREKNKQEKKDYKAAVEKLRKEKGLEPHPKYCKVTNKRIVKRTNEGVVINPHRQDEKKLMSALGLKNRKQLRKYRKKETKLKAAAVFN